MMIIKMTMMMIVGLQVNRSK